MFENIISYAYDFNIVVNGALVRELEGTACTFRCCGRCTTFCITQSSIDSLCIPGVESTIMLVRGEEQGPAKCSQLSEKFDVITKSGAWLAAEALSGAPPPTTGT